MARAARRTHPERAGTPGAVVRVVRAAAAARASMSPFREGQAIYVNLAHERASVVACAAMAIVVRADHLARFQTSLDRCLGDPVFLQRFYARFLLADEAIAAKFEKTDLKKQATVLRASLYLVLRAAQGHEDGVHHLHDVGRTHSARGYGITSEQYGVWLRTLLEVAREIDHEFDADCETAWRACLEPCVALVASHSSS